MRAVCEVALGHGNAGVFFYPVVLDVFEHLNPYAKYMFPATQSPHPPYLATASWGTGLGSYDCVWDIESSPVGLLWGFVTKT